MSAYGYSLPATAVCPGCGAVVVLPAGPILADSPPAICATCESEVPDYRRDSTSAGSEPHDGYVVSDPSGPGQGVPPEQRRFTRGMLFRSLGSRIAERGVEAVETAKDRLGG